MKRLLAFVFSLALMSAPSLAQEIQVRSGQHSDFTRLIIDLPERVEMNILQGQEEVTISFPDQNFDFDISRIFDRIARERITDVVSVPDISAMRISLGCRCEVSTFWHGNSLLVLDFQEGNPVLAGERIATEVKSEPDVTSDRMRLQAPQNHSSFAASLARSNFSERDPDTIRNPEEILDLNGTDSAWKNEGTIAEAQQKLIQQIGRAASQGLLEPRTNLNQTVTKETQPREHTEKRPGSDLQTTREPQINLKAQSSIDRDFLTAIDRAAADSFGSNCVSRDELDIASWGADTPFSEQVGHLRVTLSGEFDTLNQDAVIRLTKLYLYFGFGVEALQTLSLMESGANETAILRSLAEIMRDGHTGTNSILADQLGCNGPSALWALLSNPSLPPDLPINFDAALRSFTALPSHLRNHIGPTLARRLMTSGHEKIADKVLSILNRSEKTQSRGSQLVAAKINLSEGNHPGATEVMKEIAETNTEPSAEALISLIDATIKSNKTVSYENAVLAGSYAQQNRGNPLSNDLVRVYLTGLSASGAFEQAYEEFERLSKQIPEEFVATASSELLDLLSRNADDYTFVKHVFGSHLEDTLRLTASSAFSAADRLATLGFATQAKAFLQYPATGKAKRDRQILRAKILLREGRPRQAEAELLNIEGEVSDLLRAQARSQVGDHAAAATFYEAAGENEQSLRQAWLAEDWARLRSAQNSALADIAALSTLGTESDQDISFDSRDQRVLARNLELIQQSLSARDTVDAILGEHPSP